MAPGSVPAAGVAVAHGLPEPEVQARVTGSRRTRTLRYEVTPLPGQTVQFVEQTGASIGTARGASGKIRFTPSPGPAGDREIVARVNQDGMPRRELSVARYLAPAPRVLPAPKKIKVERTKKGVKVTWKRVRGADEYWIVVELENGRRFEVTTSRRRAAIKGISRLDGARVSVTAVSDDGALGKTKDVNLEVGRAKAKR